MIYTGYLVSHAGKIRSNNEDNGYLDGEYRTDDDRSFWACKHVCDTRLLAGVFDGVGGEECGEVASRIAAETLFAMREEDRFSELFDQYAKTANQNILEAAGSSQMASTFVLLSIEGDRYNFCNIGDSRAYLFRNGELSRISKDHNMVSKLVDQGILSPEQAKVHPDRHTIYQYLGMNSNEQMRLEPYMIKDIDVRKGDISLLCSDGLTDMVTDEEIASILDKPVELNIKMKQLLAASLHYGGRDNVTFVLIEAR